MNAGQSAIKNWPAGERPRELLFARGPEFLSDAFLIAILINSGTRSKDAVTLARELLVQWEGLRGLLNAEPGQLLKTKGMGTAKTSRLLAALEISKRLLKEKVIGRTLVQCDSDIISYLSLSLQDLNREFFKTVFLSTGNRVLAVETHSAGTLNETPVYPREIIKRALELNAAGLIFVHNHPSGNLKPSRQDLDLTERLLAACDTFKITVLDHIIISPEGHVSLKAGGYF